MSNHGLTAENMLANLPTVLRNDPNMLALAASVAEKLEQRNEDIQNVAIYTRIDELPEELLDILAYDFKVDWWDADYSLEEKREALKNNWRVHRSIGTKKAVVTALRTVCTDFEVQEWWEYGGEPGCFMVQTSSFRILYDNFQAAFFRALETAKRLSAHLDKISVVHKLEEHVCFGAADQIHIVLDYIMEDPDIRIDYKLTDEMGAELMDELGQILIG